MPSSTRRVTAQATRFTLRAVDEGAGPMLRTGAGVSITSSRRLRVGSAARDAGASALVDVRSDEVVRVDYGDGLVLWMRADDLLREQGRRVADRGDGSATWEIETRPRAAAAERGLLGMAIKTLEFFGVNLAETAALVTGKTFELQRLALPAGTQPGLFRVGLDAAGAMTRVPDQQGPTTVAAGKPVLLFLHGTMSSCKGSFGALWDADGVGAGERAARGVRETLAKAYGPLAYAFEHRSLSESPIANALALARELPVGAELHLVSHSRGGLVGELMTLAQREKSNDPITADQVKTLFAADRTIAEQLGLGPLQADELTARDAAYDTDRQALLDLARMLDDKRIRVTRFVRVACPARGTTLASGRLDRWLSVINLLTGDGLVGDLADFMLTVLKQRTDPRTLPGVEAMMPGSALTRFLQLPRLVTQADLSVIAGDVEGDQLWGKLKLLAVDWFYGGDHDLVVNTGSMTGGIRRSAGAARFRRDKGENVTHFNYFRNELSVQWLGAGLLRADGADAGFQPIAEAPQEEPRWRSAVRASRAAAAPRPLAIVIPGTMGSSLSAQDRAVWLQYGALLTGGLGDIAIGAADVHATGVIDDFYGPLIEHLARTHQVEVFAYDWRLSVRDAARRLADRLAELLPAQERARQPVHLVAHSMGGLVSRSMIADGGAGRAAWDRMKAIPGSRLLMLGTPNRGSHEAVRWLVGFNPTEIKLMLLDLTRGANGVIDVVRRYPGVAELLPFDEASARWAQAATWRELKAQLNAGWTPVDEAVLRDAADTWQLLRKAPPEPDHMLYVAGCQSATVVDHELLDVEGPQAQKRFQWIATAEGDGTVSWASGRLEGVTTYYAPDTAHDELCANTRDRTVFRGYVDLLLTGKTDQLATQPPGGVRSATAAVSDRFVLPPQPVLDDMPDAESLRGAGFGGGRRRRPHAGDAGRIAVLKVGIRHGDLAYARFPVLVGHYAGDTIVSAERALDQRLGGGQGDGPLSQQRDLDLYPGAAGTYAVFFNERPDRKPAGALVVGLGAVGELSPGRLEVGVRDALLKFVLRLVQRQVDRVASAPGPVAALPRQSAGISALLVGTGAGSLSVRDSIEAIVRGALAANQRLVEAKLDHKAIIGELEFVELYEDVAVSAARELGTLLESADLVGRVEWPQRVVEAGDGHRRRSRFDADAAWWQRIEIVQDKKADRLRFVATADRARAEETLSAGQLRLADSFIASACGSATANPNLSKTLFEMLLPNRLKESAPDRRDLVLVVDEASARFPWELLEDRWSRFGRPPAVQSGIVRQLKTSEFRAVPTPALGNTAFVVGNPSLDDWKGSPFPDLPGARREAERVQRLLSGAGFETQAAIDKTASTIIDGLHGKAWRVLHLAGHGEHEYPVEVTRDEDLQAFELPDGRMVKPVARSKTVSGMVIGERTFLTPGDVQQLRHVPELVFINCCHLGKTGGGSAEHNKLAANLGVEFIRMGVRAVVCAGWAVHDEAALAFAETFYDRLLSGESFGEAVQAARLAAWQAFPQANTWGAYQCYGDPGYRLTRESRQRPASRPAPFYSPGELINELDTLVENTRMRAWSHEPGDRDRQQAEVRAAVEGLIARIPPSQPWAGRADVCAAAGFAYGEARLFEPAIEWLERALKASKGDCPLRAAEQCANFRIRLAAAEWKALQHDASAQADAAGFQQRRQALAARIEQPLQELQVLNDRARTPERLSLLGGAFKRLAWVREGAPRSQALWQMASCYRQAWEFDPAHPGDAYTFGNWALACLLLGASDPRGTLRGRWIGPLRTLLDRQQESAAAAAEREPNIWCAVGVGDLHLVRLLLEASDPAPGDPDTGPMPLAQAALAAYQAAFARGASPREVASVQEHLDFLLEMLRHHRAARRRAWPTGVRLAVRSIRRAL